MSNLRKAVMHNVKAFASAAIVAGCFFGGWLASPPLAIFAFMFAAVCALFYWLTMLRKEELDMQDALDESARLIGELVKNPPVAKPYVGSIDIHQIKKRLDDEET